MKLYCPSCQKYVALFLTGSLRKGAQIVCAECFERYRIADDIARMAREGYKWNDNVTPDVIKDLFGQFKKQ